MNAQMKRNSITANILHWVRLSHEFLLSRHIHLPARLSQRLSFGGIKIQLVNLNSSTPTTATASTATTPATSFVKRKRSLGILNACIINCRIKSNFIVTHWRRHGPIVVLVIWVRWETLIQRIYKMLFFVPVFFFFILNFGHKCLSQLFFFFFLSLFLGCEIERLRFKIHFSLF